MPLRHTANQALTALRTALPVASPVHFIYVVCRDPQAGGGHVALYESAAEHSKSNDSKARKLRLVRGPTCILDGRLSMREVPSQSREALEVRFIPLASTCPVAWRCLMRHVSLHPSSFALPPWLRPRSNGHRRMPRQNRLRPSPHSLRKICRRAMGEAGGASFDHLVGAGRATRAAR